MTGLTDGESRTAGLLSASLGVAVPMWIDRCRALSERERAARSAVCSQYVAENGDSVLFRTGRTAEAFNRLAEGLALLAFAPGGVTFLGDHWEAV